MDFNGTVVFHQKIEKTVVGFEKQIILRLKNNDFKDLKKQRSLISMKTQSVGGS